MYMLQDTVYKKDNVRSYFTCTYVSQLAQFATDFWPEFFKIWRDGIQCSLCVCHIVSFLQYASRTDSQSMNTPHTKSCSMSDKKWHCWIRHADMHILLYSIFVQHCILVSWVGYVSRGWSAAEWTHTSYNEVDFLWICCCISFFLERSTLILLSVCYWFDLIQMCLIWSRSCWEDLSSYPYLASYRDTDYLEREQSNAKQSKMANAHYYHPNDSRISPPYQASAESFFMPSIQHHAYSSLPAQSIQDSSNPNAHISVHESLQHSSETSPTPDRLKHRKREKLKRYVRVIKFLTEIASSLFSLGMFALMVYVIVEFALTKDTIREGRGPWAKNSKVWPTILLLIASAFTLITSVGILLAYCCCFKRAQGSWKITLAKYAVHIVAWIIISFVYRYERGLHGKNNDLWGWACAEKDSPIQEQFNGVINFKSLCTGQVCKAIENISFDEVFGAEIGNSRPLGIFRLSKSSSKSCLPSGSLWSKGKSPAMSGGRIWLTGWVTPRLTPYSWPIRIVERFLESAMIRHFSSCRLSPSQTPVSRNTYLILALEQHEMNLHRVGEPHGPRKKYQLIWASHHCVWS